MAKKKKDELFKRDRVDTCQGEVLFSKLYWEPDEYSFRDKKSLKSDSDAIEQLAEDVRQAGGLLTPLLVRQIDIDKWLVLDGHRRKAAIESLVKSQAPGFEIDSLKVPVTIIISEVTKLEELMCSASANVSRLDFSKTERARVLKALYDEKCPEGEIQRILGIKESQFKRDLLIACTAWIMDMVEDKCVNYSTASRLLQVAKSEGKEAELRKALNDFVTTTKAKLIAENKRRRANDQKEKTGDQMDPQKYLKGEQVAGWEADMKAGRPLAEASFKFKATVSENQGVKKLEIGSINRNLADMNKEQIAKVIKRLTNVLVVLEPVALQKQQEERHQMALDTDESVMSAGALRLAELGIQFDDDEDIGTDGELDEMDEGTERNEEELPKATLAAATRPIDEPDENVDDSDDDIMDDDEKHVEHDPESHFDRFGDDPEPGYEQLAGDRDPEPDYDRFVDEDQLPPIDGEDWDEVQGR